MLTTFRAMPKGYELLVADTLAQQTQTWLKTQECTFETETKLGYLRILISGIPDGALFRLQQKFPANDNNNAVYEAVAQLRDALERHSWEDIRRLTSEWTDAFKKQTWCYLSAEEQQELRHLSVKNQEKRDFEEKLLWADRDILLRMVAILKAAGVLKSKTTKETPSVELVEKLIALFDQQEHCLRAALLLATN